MASESYEFRDFRVGGVPRYAQREAVAEPEPSAEFAAYGEDPDKLPGAGSKAISDELQDLDAEHGAGDSSADGGHFGDLVEDEPGSVDGHAEGGTLASDEDLLDSEVVIPAQSKPADMVVEEADESAEDHDPSDGAAAEDSAHPEAAETADRRFDDKTANPDEVAAIIAAEFGLDVAEARRLVNEAQASLDGETTDGPGESDYADDSHAPEGSAPDERGDEAESTDSTTPKIAS